MSRVLAARAATRSWCCRFGILHHQRPELLDGGAAGGAGRDQIVAGRGGIIQEFQVKADQMLKVWVSPLDRAGMPQQPWPAGR